MLKPTQDKEAISFVTNEFTKFLGLSKTDVILRPSEWADKVLKRLEFIGYYKGLPTSIEEALNSGDGTYRP